MRTLNHQLADDLTAILAEPSFIYVDSLEPQADRLPVPRGLIEGMVEAFDLADARIRTLTTMAQALAAALSDVLACEPAIANDPRIRRAQDILRGVRELHSNV
jgi:hypothetical protein